MSEKQKEMDFPLIFTDEEWGKRKLSKEELDKEKTPREFYDKILQRVKDLFNLNGNSSLNSNHLYIFNQRITEHLPVHFEGDVSKVQCPFCNKGFLKLTKIEPRHSGGLRGKFGPQYHVGNDCAYICTEEGCDAAFSCKHTWMHVD